MKSIVCFGDSNTWGYIPATGKRYPKEIRWTNILQQELGNEYEIIEEGLNGRTTVWDDPIDADYDANRNGKAYLGACIKSHFPLDLIIIMLGTNDLKVRYSVTAEDIAKSAGRLAKMVNESDCGIDGKPPKVLLVSPVSCQLAL
jgi:lysophospholipase L1-like esterase